MADRKLFSLGQRDQDAVATAPLGGTRAQAMQRLQVGLSGLGAMILLVGLANIIQDRARVADSLSVPEAAPTTEPTAAPPLSDPLADAGVVPDLPAEPEPENTQEAAVVPESVAPPQQIDGDSAS